MNLVYAIYFIMCHISDSMNILFHFIIDTRTFCFFLFFKVLDFIFNNYIYKIGGTDQIINYINLLIILT